MNIVSQIRNEVSKKQLGFGIHENVIITKVDPERQKKKDGSHMDTLLTITFGKLDDQGSVVEERDFNVWPMKSTMNADYFTDAVMKNYMHLASIFICYYEGEDVDNAFNPFNALSITDPDQIQSVLQKKSNMDLFNQELKALFMQNVDQFIGNKDLRFRLKVVYNDKGYIELPRLRYIESMTKTPLEESKLSFSVKEQEHQIEATTPKTADQLSGAGKSGLPTAGMPSVPGGMPNAGGGNGMPTPGNNPLTSGQPAPATTPTPAPAASPDAATPAPTPAPAATPQPAAAPQAEAQPAGMPVQENTDNGNSIPGAPFTGGSAPSAQPTNSPLGGIPSVQ